MYRMLMLAGCCVMALSFLSGCGETPSHAQTAQENATAAAAPSRTVNVQVEPVAPRPFKDILILPGQTEALQDVRLAMDAEGRVDWVGVEKGDLVQKGQELLRLDADLVAAQLAKAKADLALKQDLATRRQSLFQQAVLSKEEHDQALTELAVAKATVTEAETALSRTVIRAPFTGRINNVTVDPGEYVVKGEPVIEMVNVSTIRVTVSVPEMDVRHLNVGQEVAVSIDAHGADRWDGVVDFVAWKADDATKTFEVRVVVDNKDGRIRPGMASRVAFVRRDIPDALTAPLFAVVDRGGERLLYVAQDGVARARQIVIGHIAQDRVQVLEGLAAGDWLIVTGHKDVEDGMPVTVQNMPLAARENTATPQVVAQ
ncbi:putative RND family efflux transporter MFP subunit [Megalodesulfovibrio gigas DSM 1382 = ATCC 19364]|uniref:Putative RND family efflux transporter MFP subunit n=2 Tax=Megalodesulfovibrio gigas TaxID=879 RepID=T2GCC9_MEGG1|nr:putative RND family efflux transporter MFP subunit [Megalodesulfovibrio gigas DSM 1382 = ATCC 19364]